jgi:cysteine desulfurase
MHDDVIYLDFNASTPCDPLVVEAMLPFFTDIFANAASLNHRPGQKAFTTLEEARAQIARLVHAKTAADITFTSGATEANNLIIKGIAEATASSGRHLITQVTEHPSVLEPMRHMAARGWELTEIGVDSEGTIRLDELAEAIRPDTTLMSIMLANNETGTIQPVAEVTRLAHEHGVVVHCDAAQGPGKIAVDIEELGADYITLSAHKLHGPKGVGAVCKGTETRHRLAARIHGGGQENGLRSGTSNVAGAVGFAAAMRLAASRWSQDALHMAELRDRLEHRITGRLDGSTVNGATGRRLPGTSNLSFAGTDANALLASLTDLAISSGSACTSAHAKPSYVLRSMGVRPDLAAASIRFSVGRTTTAEEVDRAADRLVEEVTRLRAMKKRRPTRRR